MNVQHLERTGRMAGLASGRMAGLSLILSLAPAAAFAAPAPPPPPPATPRVSIERQLMITHLGVVEDPVRTNARDPRSPWTFRHLVEGLAGPRDPSEFVLDWLRQFELDQVAPGGVAPARPDVRRLITDPWRAASGGGRLDLAKAPFKLLAITNRMDLRDTFGMQVRSAGEGRFVFGVTQQDGTPLPPSAGPAPGGLFVIFEYALVADSPAELRSWAESWAALGGHSAGSPAHREALERVTRRFTDQRYPGRPNGSAISQIRTNDIALGPTWELREFHLDQTGFLRTATTAGTPDTVELNGTPDFARLINDNSRSILDGTFELAADLETPGSLSGPFVPEDFPDFLRRTFVTTPIGGPFLDIPWSAAGIRDNDARQALAVSTCNGCHRGETGTPFVHVAFPVDNALPQSLGMPAALSGFLTGITVPDPVRPDQQRTFADLERRRVDLEALFAAVLGGPDRRPPQGQLPRPIRVPMARH